MDIKSRDPKEKFIHRDLSWLSFNERVLEEALDAVNPLLERLKFLAIFANNLDEFFIVRVAGLKRLLDAGYNKRNGFGYYPQELQTEIKAKVEQLIKKFYDIYHGKITKELYKHNISFLTYEELNNAQKRYVKRYFESTIFPVITPLAIDQGRPFPVLPSKTIAYAVQLMRKEVSQCAIIPLPKNVSRFVKLPSEQDQFSFILIDDILRHSLDSFFKGYKIVDQALFRIMRDSELSFEEEYRADLLRVIQDELKKRPRAKIVHLEHEHSISPALLDFLSQGFEFPIDQMMNIKGTLDLTCLFELIAGIAKPDLEYKSFVPAKLEYENIFERMKEGDFVLHLPYQSFQPTVDLVEQAAHDDNVLAIKMTLYRTNQDSAIIQALKEAATRGKQVTILVEIKARFDEARNIQWVEELENAGCHVMYGIAGMKIHSKIVLIVRQEEGRIHRYVHLSTGNYNEKTARVYTDIGYFTANEDFARDLSDMFNVITGFSLPSRWKRIISSPYDLRQYFFELIDREIECQKKYKNGLITAKMNSLEDTDMIEKLYEASCAGVKIKLIIRGICCLIPGVPKMSENIEVKSIVGRFLEHSRIYCFNNNANCRVFIASADWMSRNFDRRIELMFEIFNEELKEHLCSIVNTYWQDTVKARTLQADKSYSRTKKGEEKFTAQDYLLKSYVT